MPAGRIARVWIAPADRSPSSGTGTASLSPRARSTPANSENPLDRDLRDFQVLGVRPARKHQSNTEPNSLAERFRPQSRQLDLHPKEKWTLFWVTLHLCFLPWALGTMHLWSQCVSLALAVVGFVVAAQPRNYTDRQTGTGAVRVRPLQRLWRFPLFWVGLLVLVYIIVQGLNPAWQYRSNASYWWIEPIEHLSWLPHGMKVPFATAGPWRALLINTSLWLTLCTVWIGLMRRLSFRLLFTFLVANGVLLAGLGLAQQLTHATGIFWSLKVNSQSFVASFIYRNHAGAYLNLVLAIAAGLAWWYHTRAHRHLAKSSPAGVFTFGAVAIGVMVLFSLSRGATITMITFLILAGGAFAWSQVRQPDHQRGRIILLGLLVLLGGFVAVGFYALKAENVWQRFEGLIVDPIASTSDRIQAHTAATEMLAQHPVLGWGAGCFRFGFPGYCYRHPEIYYSGPSHRKLWEHAHNDLLEYPIEYGFVGATIIAAGLAWLCWHLIRRRFWANPLAMLATLGAGLTFAHAWGDFVFQNPAVLFTWSITVLAAGRWAELDRQPA